MKVEPGRRARSCPGRPCPRSPPDAWTARRRVPRQLSTGREKHPCPQVSERSLPKSRVGVALVGSPCVCVSLVELALPENHQCLGKKPPARPDAVHLCVVYRKDWEADAACNLDSSLKIQPKRFLHLRC